MSDSIEKALKKEFEAAKKSPVDWAKENPIKTSVAFFMLPFDWIIGAPLSIALTAGGLGYGAYKHTQNPDTPKR